MYSYLVIYVPLYLPRCQMKCAYTQKEEVSFIHNNIYVPSISHTICWFKYTSYDIYKYLLYNVYVHLHIPCLYLLPELPALLLLRVPKKRSPKTVSSQVSGPGLKVRRALSSVVTILHVSDTHSLHRSTGDAGSWGPRFACWEDVSIHPVDGGRVGKWQNFISWVVGRLLCGEISGSLGPHRSYE